MHRIEFFFSVIAFVFALIILCLYVLNLLSFIISIYSVKRMHRRSENLTETPGISILKPLMGIDSCLRENLLSHFNLKYPKFELIFCVQDESDPVIDLVQSLRDEFPQVDTRLLVGHQMDIVNPLISNMTPGYAAAKHDLIWVTTSKIRVSTDILLDLVEKALPSDVGLVHQPPFYADQPNFLGVVEKVCFGCSIMRPQLALNQLDMIFFIGMSYVLKKSHIDKLGGLSYYGKYLAEDFFIATDIHNQGYRSVMSNYPAQQNLVTSTISVYTNRMVRWLRLRLGMVPVVAAFIEPMCEPLILGCLFSVTLHYLFDVQFLPVLVIHAIAWILLDYSLLRGVQHTGLRFSFPTFVAAWFIREMLTYWIFFCALWKPSQVSWGKYTYHVQMGGLTHRLPSPTFGVHSQLCKDSELPTLMDEQEIKSASITISIPNQHNNQGISSQWFCRHHLVPLQYHSHSHSVREDEQLISNANINQVNTHNIPS